MSHNKEDDKRLWVLGPRAVQEALRGDLVMDKVWVVGPALPRLRHLLADIEARGVPCKQVSGRILQHMVGSTRHQGIALRLSHVPFADLSERIISCFEQGISPLVLLVQGCTDVHNFGALARSAEGMGVHALVIEQEGTPPLDATAIRCSAGALLHLPLCRSADFLSTYDLIRSHGLRVLASSPEASTPLWDAKLDEPLALVVGGEQKGLPPPLLKKADECLSIPMYGKTASLNIAQATTLLLYEAARQRRPAS